MVSEAKEKPIEKQAMQAGEDFTQQKGPITKEMNIGEVVARWPEVAEIMMAYGLHCIGCHVNPFESIEAGCYGHGMSPETISQLVKELNEAVDGGNSKAESNEVNLSDYALKKFAELMEKEGKAGWGLKLTVEPQGCSGFDYIMDFAEKPEQDERTVVEKGMKVFIKENIFPMVNGIRVDYHSGPSGGFRISNPNKIDSCTPADK